MAKARTQSRSDSAPRGGRYQLLGALAPEPYLALENDIRKRNRVLVPVEVDQDGNILDGHHRAEIATRLGVPFKTVVQKLATETEKKDHVLSLNLVRRHMDATDWGFAFKALLELRGVRRGSGRQKEATVALFQAAQELGVSPRTARWRLRQADQLEALEEEAPALAAEVKSKAKPLKAAQKEAKRKVRAKERAAGAASVEKLDLDDRVRLQHMGIEELSDFLVEDSVDCILTDPPYGKDALGLYEWLGVLAAKVLRPGGSCFVMIGQSYLPEILAVLSKHLRYHWCIAYTTPGGQSAQLWTRNINTFWKPVLWLTKGGWSGDWVGDVVSSDVNDNDKRFHHWGQSESGMLRLVEKYTAPGQWVLDPFLGGGTTAVACFAGARRFVGADSQAQALETTRARLAQMVTGDV